MSLLKCSYHASSFLCPPPRQPGDQQQPRAIGPVERRLLQFGEVKGWCFGAWGEVSLEVHHLVQRLAEARIATAETLPGQRRPIRSRTAEKAGPVSYIRRALSVTAVRAQAKFLLDIEQIIVFIKDAL